MIKSVQDILPKLDDVNNQITMAEAELKRLQGLKRAEEYTIGELVKEKKYHLDEIANLKADLEDLNKQLADLHSSLTKANSTIENAESVAAQHAQTLASIEVAKNQLKGDTSLAHKALEDRESSVAEKEVLSENRKQELDERAVALETKRARLSKFLAELGE